jgi:hypothetical protein
LNQPTTAGAPEETPDWLGVFIHPAIELASVTVLFGFRWNSGHPKTIAELTLLKEVIGLCCK